MNGKAPVTHFAWGIAIPSVLFGLVLAETGIGVGAGTNGQVAGPPRGFHEGQAEMVRTDFPRMQKVNANFRITIFSFGALASIGLLIDGVAERRAVPNTRALETIAEQHTDHPSRP